jgi:cytochrome c556
MMDHLVAIQGIVDGLARDDWADIEGAVAKIASSDPMRRMCEHMGSRAEGFTHLGLEFHQGADAIGDAARQRDAASVLRATSATLAACTRCHAKCRQRVVDRSTWQREADQQHSAP